MKSWKEQPQLFANGKFEIRINGGNKFQLVGCQPSTVFDGEKAILFYNMSGQIVEKPVLNCTLIARPISDMTDEELSVFENMVEPDIEFKYRENHWLFMDHPESFLYLLSIGVYPFDQSHFENGDVILQ